MPESDRPHSRAPLAALMVALVPCVLGCSQPERGAGSGQPFDVRASHSPVVALATESVGFSAQLTGPAGGVGSIEIVVDNNVVQHCADLSVGETCDFNGGPFPAYAGGAISYLARVIDGNNVLAERGPYYFAIVGADYSWAKDYLPARITGPLEDKVDFVFHWDPNESAFPPDDWRPQLVASAGDKIWGVLAADELLGRLDHLDRFNFYLFPEAASIAGCGTVSPSTEAAMPWRDVDAVLHESQRSDCASQRHFTAESSTTHSFLHESGHAVFLLADEYAADCGYPYFESPVEPNIFAADQACTAEQGAKSRPPAACDHFLDCGPSWWGVHTSLPATVMVNGDLGDPWGIEAEERVRWVLNQYP